MFKTRVVLSGVVALACSSCSFIFVHPPHHADDQLTGVPRHCTSSPAAPIVDAAIGTLQVVRTGLALSNDESAYQGQPISRSADIGFGVGFAALFLASSIYGFYETSQCHSSAGRVTPPEAPESGPPPPVSGDRHSGAPTAPPPVSTTRPRSPEEP